MRVAKFSKKFKTLEYFDSRNTSICIYCENYKMAQRIVFLSGITQELKKV